MHTYNILIQIVTMYYYILSMLMLLILTAIILIVVSYYRPHVLAQLWNKIIDTRCDQQDIHAINGIPTYYPVELVNSVDINMVHQSLQLYCNEVLSEVILLTKENTDSVIPISAKTPVLKSIIDGISQLLSGSIIVCRPGVTITDISSPFRFVQRYCYALQIPTYDVGLNLDGYDVKWEPHSGTVWDSSIRQTMWNHTKFMRIVIMVDFYRPLPLLQHIGSKLVHYLCRELLTTQLETAELTRIKMIA